jgi:predicted kinase
MSRPALVLVTGRPAAGKTTFARLLGWRLPAPMFAKDDFKKRLFEKGRDRRRRVFCKTGSAAMGRPGGGVSLGTAGLVLPSA